MESMTLKKRDQVDRRTPDNRQPTTDHGNEGVPRLILNGAAPAKALAKASRAIRCKAALVVPPRLRVFRFYRSRGSRSNDCTAMDPNRSMAVRSMFPTYSIALPRKTTYTDRQWPPLVRNTIQQADRSCSMYMDRSVALMFATTFRKGRKLLHGHQSVGR